mmetsp:Transcript_11594/g.14629  ORF Transcript_11594/g.14629 Transcript_11594/m.14629 type:complete len:93 (+) Transcript_11594:106-384(+)
MAAIGKKEQSPAEVFFKNQSKSDHAKYEQFQVPEELFDKKQDGDLKKLNARQVEKGIVRLKFKHPLTDSSFFDVFPSLRFFKKCFGSDEVPV